MEIWARRCERCLKTVLGDFRLEANGVALDWGKTIEKQEKKMKRLIGDVKHKIS